MALSSCSPDQFLWSYFFILFPVLFLITKIIYFTGSGTLILTVVGVPPGPQGDGAVLPELARVGIDEYRYQPRVLHYNITIAATCFIIFYVTVICSITIFLELKDLDEKARKGLSLKTGQWEVTRLEKCI